jgi:LysM repeat protein
VIILNIHITEISTGKRITLSLLPDRVKVGGAAEFQSFDIINKGTVKLPKGTEPLEISWDGTLPGKSRKKASYVVKKYWQEPQKIIAVWEKWRREGTRLNLMVTMQGINNDVYLNDYFAEPHGGNGDFDYSISFCQARLLRVYTMAELKSRSKKSKKTSSRAASPKATKKTYKTVPGDSLWKIAQKKLKKGSRWPEIYALNKDKIKSPDVITEGINLTLPT